MPACQLAPLSIDRQCPSSPQMSTMPPGCATTSHTFAALPAPAGTVVFLGSMNVQVAPESVLRATPQLVPMKTLAVASGRTEMPKAEGSSSRAAAHAYPPGGLALAGLAQFVPASVETWIPETGVFLTVEEGCCVDPVVVTGVDRDVPHRHRQMVVKAGPRRGAVGRLEHTAPLARGVEDGAVVAGAGQTH